MAFDQNALIPIGGQDRYRRSTPQGSPPTSGAGVALWGYFHASDNLATIKGAGYFNDARDRLGDGDVIMVSENGASVSFITMNAVPATGNVTVQTADINSA